MKKSIILSLCTFVSLCLCVSVNAQTIRRCNNDPNVPLGLNMYRTLQEAHDAASAGDIIYIEPSFVTSCGSGCGEVSYGDLTCTKALRIIGNGYNHEQNTGTFQNWDHRASKVGNISIEAGSGTVIQGVFLAGSITIKASNVSITRCVVSGTIYLKRINTSQNASGTNIADNYFPDNYYYTPNIDLQGYQSSDPITCFQTANQVQNVVIKNNINIRFTGLGNYGNSFLAYGGNCTGGSTQVPHAINITITNNILYPSVYTGFILGCQNCTVHSNIFRSTPANGILINSPGTTASFNVCGTNPCGYGTNNVDAANESILFTGGVNLNYDKDYQLTSYSPAKGAGLGGVDAGASGTNDPYRLSGLAPIPQISAYSQNASSGIYTTATPMSITISVRGNN